MSAWTVFAPGKHPVFETPFTIWNELQAAAYERVEAINPPSFPSNAIKPTPPLLTEHSENRIPWGEIRFSYLGELFLQTDLVEEIKKKAEQVGATYIARSLILNESSSWLKFLHCGEEDYAARRGFLYSPEKLDSIHTAYEAYLYYQRINDMIYPVPNNTGTWSFRKTWLNTGKVVRLSISKYEDFSDGYNLVFDRLDRMPCYVRLVDEINDTVKFIGVVEAVVVGDGWDYDEGYHIMKAQINKMFDDAVADYPETSYTTYGDYDAHYSDDADYINSELVSLEFWHFDNAYNVDAKVNLKDIFGLKYQMRVDDTFVDLESPYVPELTVSRRSHTFYTEERNIYTIPEKLDLQYYDPPEDAAE